MRRLVVLLLALAAYGEERKPLRELVHGGDGSELHAIRALAFSPDGTRLATGGPDAVRLWDPQSGAELWRAEIAGRAMDGESKPSAPDVPSDVTALLFDREGKWIANGTHRCGLVQIRNPETGALEATLDGHGNFVTGLAQDPSGRKLLSTAWGKKSVIAWDLATSKALWSIDGDPPAVSVVWDARGRGIAVGRHGGAILLMDDHGEQRNGVDAHTRGDPQLVPVGDATLVSSGFDRRVCAWNIGASWTPEREMRADGYPVCLAATGKTVFAAVTGSESKPHLFVQAWDLETGAHKGTWRDLHGAADVQTVACSPDGKLLATGGWRGRVRIWWVEALLAKE